MNYSIFSSPSLRKLSILLAACCLFLAYPDKLTAQYKSALGVRLGLPNSVSYKQFIKAGQAVEVYVGTRSIYLNASLAYQVHKALKGTPIDGLNWYAGAGISMIVLNLGNGDVRFQDPFYSFQAYLGLDYAFEEIPVNLSIDWVPTVFRGNRSYNRIFWGTGNLSIRYILK
ncbi:MAG: hypothetical protein AAFY71_03420 [Bacteroidota bacterium]